MSTRKSRSEHFYKTALISIDNALTNVECLSQSLNFKDFGDKVPTVHLSEKAGKLDVWLFWDDVIFGMGDVVEAVGKYGEINPRILCELVCNYNNE